MEFISIPVKKTSEVDMKKPLTNAISTNYNTSDNTDGFKWAVEELNILRSQAASKFYDVVEESLEPIYRYVDELYILAEKLGISSIPDLKFKWKAAFEKGNTLPKLFSGISSIAKGEFKYEILCMLFNVAALLSQIASSQPIKNDDRLQKAAKYFQLSAGLFKSVLDIIVCSNLNELTPDIHPNMLQALMAIMVAQGQEVIVLKAISDVMKPASTAKLASQCEEYFTEAMNFLLGDYVKIHAPTNWISIMNAKSLYYRGVAEYYQSLVCGEEKSVGEQIARLRAAISFITEGDHMCDKPLYPVHHNKAMSALKEAEKDNNFIYHEKIPEFKSLPRVGKLAVAKIKPVSLTTRLSTTFQDLFKDLTPLSVHQAMAAYDVRKADRTNQEVNKLREATQLLNSILASLNLPAALEDTGSMNVPQSVIEKSETVRTKGGLQALAAMQELPLLLQRNEQLLTETERIMQEEKQTDDEMRNKFKEKWTITPSEKLTETVRNNLAVYKKMIQAATAADKNVERLYESHREKIDLLSRGKDAIEQALPSGTCGTLDRNSSVAQRLHAKIQEVEALKSERSSLENAIETQNFINIKETFMNALREDGCIQESEISEHILRKSFEDLGTQIRNNLEKQERLMSEVQTLNTEFCKEKNDTSSNRRREEFLKELAAAFDAFVELTKNLQDGTKFYNEMTETLVAMQTKVTDFSFARKTERQELIKSLTAQLNKTVTDGQVPTAPPHHNANSMVNSQPAQPLHAYQSNTLPYPLQPSNMPMPYAVQINPTPYPSYPPVIFHPYATMPNMQNVTYAPYPVQQYGQAQQPHPNHPQNQ